MNICIFGASSKLIDKSFLDAAYRLGQEIGRRKHSLVFGGGGNGIMGAVARGTKAYDGTVIGVSPKIFNVDGVLYERCDELHITGTMSERKDLLEDLADAFVILPGGIGTFDEFFEVLTLNTLGYHSKPIVILNTDGYFNGLLDFMKDCVSKGFLKGEVLKLMPAVDEVDDVFEYFDNYISVDSGIGKYKNV